MKRVADASPETSALSSSSEEEEDDDGGVGVEPLEDVVKISPLEISHTRLLLRLCLLSSHVRDLETRTVTAYRELIITKSCAAWKSMPREWLQWSADKKGVAIVDFLHSGCCPVGKAGMQTKCNVTIELEKDVITCVNHMIKDKTYRE